jgi:SAM-dependent methyltransferase
MSVCLATTWFPRGEYARFERFLPMLMERYAGIVIIILQSDDQVVMRQLSAPEFTSNSRLRIYLHEAPRNGRYKAIKYALETDADYIHYVDMDRLLHWVETQPDEWKQMISEIEKFDCIVFGRTREAFLTHPQALITTEQVSNNVVSYLLKKEMDVSAGSKSFSRSAAQYVIEYCAPDNSIGTDAEWPILIKQAGFKMEHIQVNGLDWESADQYQDQAATNEIQSRAAREYDTDPDHWSRRIKITDEIIQTALDVSQKKYPPAGEKKTEPMEFDFEAVFDADDYIYFYSEALTDERTDEEVSALVRLLKLDYPRKILDLACGFGRHSNRLAAMGHQITGIDLTEGFLEMARQDAMNRGVDVQYQQGDMRNITFINEFDCVLLLFTAFGYFSDEENLQVLVKVRNALLPGGLLVFDTPNRDLFLKTIQPYYVVEKEGNMMIDRMSFDSFQGRSYNRRVVFRDGIRKDKPFSIRLYNPSEIQALITQAGLVTEHIYAGWDAEALTSESRRLVVISRKPG